MYNRYIPQPDGTYRRSAVREPTRPQEPKPEKPQPCVPPPPPRPPEQAVPPKHCGNPCLSGACVHPGKRQEVPPCGIGTFLKQLLPRNFDTADLIVVLLLLLIASDGCEDGNTALLTLILYLFL